MDNRAGDGGEKARPEPGCRPIGHAFFPARLGLRRGDALPLDDVRFLAHGRDRVRHRQAAPGARGGQHPRRRHADVPQPVGAHRRRDAQEGPRQGDESRSVGNPSEAPGSAGSPLRTLRKDIRVMAGGGNRSAAVFHRRLQQHLDLEAGLRLHLRLHSKE